MNTLHSNKWLVSDTITKAQGNSVIKMLIVAILLILMSGCVTNDLKVYPKALEDQATFYASETIEAIEKGDCHNAALHIGSMLSRPTGDIKTVEVFTRYPKSQDCYYSYLKKKIVDVSNASQAAEVSKKLSDVKAGDIFSEEQTRTLSSTFRKRIIDGNISGSVPFMLGDNIDDFPELKAPWHQDVILNRTINTLQKKGTGTRPVPGLMQYVIQVGVDSVEGKRIEALLPTLNIRLNEIDFVAKVFPKFAADRKEAITVCVYLQVKNGDRIFMEDIRQMLNEKAPCIEWVSSIGPKTTTLVIERVRDNEQTLPERRQTITYGQHEVDFMKAAFLMPSNASFIYDVIYGGTEIEYGYVVTAITGEKTVYDEIVRGRVGGEYHQCQNYRIQNVFGGTSSANFVANNDMRNRCGGPKAPSIEDLRQEVFSKLVDCILKVPPIKVAHNLN